MIVTCFLRYVVDPYKLDDFETYGRMWIRLVEKFGGDHHGYFMPSEGTSNVALAMFTFPSLAEYERYREASMSDAECQEAWALAERTRCIVSWERSFFRPVFRRSALSFPRKRESSDFRSGVARMPKSQVTGSPPSRE